MTPEQWLEANGGPRRFEPGATGDIGNLRSWLTGRGYEIIHNARILRVKKIGARGAPKNMTPAKLIAFVDELRRAEGLEPLRPIPQPHRPDRSER